MEVRIVQINGVKKSSDGQREWVLSELHCTLQIEFEMYVLNGSPTNHKGPLKITMNCAWWCVSVYFGDLFVAIVEWLRRCDATRHTIVFTNTPCSATDANSFVIIKCWLAAGCMADYILSNRQRNGCRRQRRPCYCFSQCFPSFHRPSEPTAMSIRMHFVRMEKENRKRNRLWISFAPVFDDEVFKLMHLPNNVNVKHRSMFEVRANKSTAASEKQLVNHKSRRIKCIYAVTLLSSLNLLWWIDLFLALCSGVFSGVSAHEFE